MNMSFRLLLIIPTCLFISLMFSSCNSIIVQPDNINGITTGKINSTFEVSSQGGASYRIPLWVPQGRLGIQPDIALEYDSNSGNGILGVGWNLSGLSQIVRCRKNKSVDSTVESVNFSNIDDALSLDGERLILVKGVKGTNGAEYKTQRNTFAKIIMNAPDQFGPKSFTVYRKDGRIFHYGETSSARIEGLKDSIRPIGWKVPDPHELSLDKIAANNIQVFPYFVRYGWLRYSLALGNIIHLVVPKDRWTLFFTVILAFLF